MAVLYIYESPNAPVDVYDRVSAQLREQGMPPGCLHHTACTLDGDRGLCVVEVWESEEAQDKWDKVVQEKIATAGGPARPKPRKLHVHNMMSGDVHQGAKN